MGLCASGVAPMLRSLTGTMLVLQGLQTAEGDICVYVQVMMQTARFVRQEGDQLELVLRIRQGHNASFRFLKPDSHLHDYYRWLVHAEPQVSSPCEDCLPHGPCLRPDGDRTRTVHHPACL